MKMMGELILVMSNGEENEEGSVAQNLGGLERMRETEKNLDELRILWIL